MSANLGVIMCFMVSPYISAARVMCMVFGETQTSKICGLPSRDSKLCCTHLAFVVAAVAAVVGLCYMGSTATMTAIPHIMPSESIVDMLVQRRVCGSVHHRESKCGH